MRLLKLLYIQVLIAIILGAVVGYCFPKFADAGKIISTKFIDLIKMIVTPIIFFTIVQGIAGAGSIKKMGRIGGKAILYFEIVTTIALFIGIVVANIVKPGLGVTTDSTQLNNINKTVIVKPGLGITTDSTQLNNINNIDKTVNPNQTLNWVDFITHIIPNNFLKAFVEGDILQVLFISILFAVAMLKLGKKAEPILNTIDNLSAVFFKIMKMIMYLAPLGAFGGMVYTIGNYGLEVLLNLSKLILCFYITVFLFVAIVLNLIMRYYGFSLIKLIKYLKEEIFITLGASSSEAVLPNLMEKLQNAGCQKSVVGLVVPAGYSFNLDGTTIYLSMATIFLAQVGQIPLSITQQLTIIAILMLTSKGAAGVTGSGFVVLASTLSALKIIPVYSSTILLGIDRFMSEARSVTNFIGNAVATVIIAKSENAIDMGTYKKIVEANT